MWHFLVAQTQSVAQDTAPAGGAQPGNPLMSMLPMIIAFFAIMYFLMIRPQQKRERERRNMLGSLAKGCLLYTSDAADDLLCVDIGGRRIIKKKTI